MKKIALALFLGFAALAVASPADARVSVGIGIGGCCGGYYPGYYAPYYGYAPYYYAPPPTVVYAPPPAVTYVQPQPQQVIVQQQQPSAPPPGYQDQTAPSPSAKGKNSQSFTDEQGRTCRHFETTVNGDVVGGTACLQPDGTWRTVDEQ